MKWKPLNPACDASKGIPVARTSAASLPAAGSFIDRLVEGEAVHDGEHGGRENARRWVFQGRSASGEREGETVDDEAGYGDNNL